MHEKKRQGQRYSYRSRSSHSRNRGRYNLRHSRFRHKTGHRVYSVRQSSTNNHCRNMRRYSHWLSRLQTQEGSR